MELLEKYLDVILSNLDSWRMDLVAQYDGFMNAVNIAQSGESGQDPCEASKLYYARAGRIVDEARSYRKLDLSNVEDKLSEFSQKFLDKKVASAHTQIKEMELYYEEMTTKLRSLRCDPREVQRRGEEELAGLPYESQDRVVKKDERQQEQQRPPPGDCLTGGCLNGECGEGVSTAMLLPVGLIFVRVFRRKRKRNNKSTKEDF